MLNISGYTDWIASANIVQEELKAIGIKITTSNLRATPTTTTCTTGQYQLAYDGNEAGGPTPYYEMRQELYSKNSAPIGKLASSNWERYYNKNVDKLIEAVRHDDELGKAALDHQPARGGDGAGTSRSSRSPRGSTGTSTTRSRSRDG